MKIENVYPPQSKKKLFLDELRAWTKWPLIAAAYACPVINLLIGGKAWSVVALWGLWMLWSLVLSRDLVEYNRISQTSKLLFDGIVMLILIGTLLSPGWAEQVVPLVCIGGLVVIGILFFTDIEKQKQNMMPMLWLILFSVAAVIMIISFWTKNNNWEIALLATTALALLGGCYRVVGSDLPREIKKRFHTR